MDVLELIENSCVDFDEVVQLHIQNSLESFRLAFEMIYEVNIESGEQTEDLHDAFYKSLKGE